MKSLNESSAQITLEMERGKKIKIIKITRNKKLIAKGESGYLNRFDSLGELIEYIFGYLNYYNKLRIHTKLKISPYQFKQKVSECVLEKWGT